MQRRFNAPMRRKKIYRMFCRKASRSLINHELRYIDKKHLDLLRGLSVNGTWAASFDTEDHGIAFHRPENRFYQSTKITL